MDISELWAGTLALLEPEISPISFKTWIEPIVPVKISGNTVVLRIDESFIKSMVETRFLSLIENSVKHIMGCEDVYKRQLYICTCTSSGRDVDIPCMYISHVSSPSGSINIWCLSLSANLTILDVYKRQFLYMAPFPVRHRQYGEIT